MESATFNQRVREANRKFKDQRELEIYLKGKKVSSDAASTHENKTIRGAAAKRFRAWMQWIRNAGRRAVALSSARTPSFSPLPFREHASQSHVPMKMHVRFCDELDDDQSLEDTSICSHGNASIY